MGYSRFDPAISGRAAWNAGKNVGTKRPLTQKQIWAIRFHLDREGRLRDKALFDLAIDSKLRGCDLVKIKIGDVVAGSDIRNRAIVIQQKTNRPVQFELTADVRAALIAWLERRGGAISDYLFASRVDPLGLMSNAPICPFGRRMGDRRRTSEIRIRHAFAPSHESRHDLSSHGQHPSDPDFAGPHQDREHGPVSWRRRRRRSATRGAHRNLTTLAVGLHC